jgi:hypothetical protein
MKGALRCLPGRHCAALAAFTPRTVSWRCGRWRNQHLQHLGGELGKACCLLCVLPHNSYPAAPSLVQMHADGGGLAGLHVRACGQPGKLRLVRAWGLTVRNLGYAKPPPASHLSNGNWWCHAGALCLMKFTRQGGTACTCAWLLFVMVWAFDIVITKSAAAWPSRCTAFYSIVILVKGSTEGSGRALARWGPSCIAQLCWLLSRVATRASTPTYRVHVCKVGLAPVPAF